MILEIAATLPLRCGGVLGLFSALASNLPTVDKHAAAIDGHSHSLFLARVTLASQSSAMSQARPALPVRSLSSSTPRPPS
jgi:hypothetical protein